MAAEGGGAKALSQREQDIQMMLAADVHLGTKNCDFQMERYVYKRRTDGTYRFLFFLLVEITDLSAVFV
jgi:small subunit ribosomal protein SAe